MNTDELVKAAHLLAVGKIPEFSSDDKKYQRLVGIANIKIGEWEREFFWDSLYTPKYLIGTVSSTSTYDLDDEIREISETAGDSVVIEHPGGGETYYDTVTPDNLKSSYGDYCAKAGRQLIFNTIFKPALPQFGGSIYAPVYRYAERLSRPKDIVPVDDPNWLIKMVAAEWVRNDILKQNQYSNLVNEANALMENMKKANMGQVAQVQTGWRPGGYGW